jgi:hypothetical protein
LSGNNILFFILLGLFSCSAPKATKKQDDVQVVKAEKKTPTTTKPETSGQPIPAKKDNPSSTVKVDTVVWKDVSPYKDPITIKKQKDVEYREGLDIRNEYNITMLIPLDSDGHSDPSSSRFVHFYAGALRAFETLNDEGIKLNVKVIDTEEGSLKVADKMTEVLGDNTDMIIGPFERDDLKILADECKSRSIPLVSPWQTSTKLTNENPYYIQMKPNLKEHFLKLAESTYTTYLPGEVAIIGKNNKDTNAWIKYFQEAAATSTKSKEFYLPYFVSNDSLNTGPTAFHRLFKNNKIKAIIIPNYSYSDEDFIYGCLRRLGAEKGMRQISVFGMPILFDSDKVDFDFYNALQMKVVMSDFVDENHGKIREFRRDYLDMYGEIPNADAVKGYDLILYLGRNIWKYGKNFQNYLENEATSYLQSTYDIRKAKSDDSPIANDPVKFDFYENKHLDIIEFKGNKWQRKL